MLERRIRELAQMLKEEAKNSKRDAQKYEEMGYPIHSAKLYQEAETMMNIAMQIENILREEAGS